MKNRILLLGLLIISIFILGGCEIAEKAMEKSREVCNNNGELDPDELCDDGNDVSTDMCDKCVPTYCGDDLLNDNPMNAQSIVEQCDNEDQEEANKQCVDGGFLAPCNIDTCRCSGIAPPPPPACNLNNKVEGTEECDKGPAGDSTCTNKCTLTYCGDSSVQKPNGKDLNNKQPGFNEVCDAGPNPFDPNDKQTKAAHAFCQAALADPLAMCVGCQCRAPPWSCTAGAFWAAFGPLGALPPGAVCKDDCVKNLGPDWKCDMVTCACTPKPKPKFKCAGNTISSILGGKNKYKPGLVCKDDCKALGKFIGVDLVCDTNKCVCQPKKKEEVTCADNTLSKVFGGKGVWSKGKVCKDNCKDLAKAVGANPDKVRCDMDQCVCVGGPFKPEDGDGEEEPPKEKQTISCAENRDTVLGGKPPVKPTADMLCDNKCPEDMYCNEHCVCDTRRVVTPRCGDGFISSIWIGGGGSEECDLGGRNNAPVKPDTCPSPTQCINCKCITITEVPRDEVAIGQDALDVCGAGEPESFFDIYYEISLDDQNCGGACLPHQHCDMIKRVGASRCYGCIDLCQPGEFYKDKAACERMCGERRCEARGNCYYCGRSPYEERDEEITTGTGPGEQIPPTDGEEPQELDCENECSKRGYSTSPEDWSSYILNYLNKYTCVSGASIKIPGTLTLTGPAGDKCTCYSKQQPVINVDATPPKCNTACGMVECDTSTTCTVGDKQVTASCTWAGWKDVGNYRFQPVFGG